MRAARRTRSAACALAAVLVAFVAALAAPARAQTSLPAAVELVAVRAFSLGEGYRYEWCAEAPRVDEGLVLVLRADPDLLRPRAVGEPVLYAGGIPAERVHAGHLSGHVVVIVPGRPALETTRLWLGEPALPERIDARHGLEQEALARAAGIAPPDARQIERARQRGGASVTLPDRDALRPLLADWIERWAPQDRSAIRAYSVPRAPTAATPLETK